MNPRDLKRYPNLIALLDARRRECRPCKHCGLINAAWPGSDWTQDHPSCIRTATKRIEALKQIREQKAGLSKVIG